jgi:hypothetical protein
LRVAGMEIAVRTAAGPLETLLCSRYAAYLGTIERPDSRLDLSALRRRRDVANELSVTFDGKEVRLDHPMLEARLTSRGHGNAHVAAHPAAVDTLLAAVAALLAPPRGCLLLAGTGVISRGRGHLIVGKRAETDELIGRAAGRPIIQPPCVAVRDQGSWMLMSTPFATGSVARVAPLRAIWSVDAHAPGEADPMSGAECAVLAIERAIMPLRSWQLDAALDVATDLARAVPAARLLDAQTPWHRIDELAAALTIRRALESNQPELSMRLLRNALPRVSDRGLTFGG